MELEFVVNKKNVPSLRFYLVFFTIGSQYVTKVAFKNNEFENYVIYNVKKDILRRNPLPDNIINDENFYLININNTCQIKVGWTQKENSALCVDFLMPASTSFLGYGEKTKIYASATIFKKYTEYHLLDYALAGKQDLLALNKHWHFVSYGFFVSKKHSFCKERLPVCEIQHNFLKLIKKYLSDVGRKDFIYDDPRLENVKVTPFHLNNRMFFAVHTLHYLKYIKIPEAPMFGVIRPEGTIESQITEVVQRAFNWISLEKSFAREMHGNVLVSAWKSLFLQDAGNCLDMAITMYQILMCYFRNNEKYQFTLASVLIDDYLPHCICVILPLPANRYGRPMIVDATRLIDVPFPEPPQYISAYRYITGIYTQENCYWVVKKDSDKTKVHLGVTMNDFMQNKYDIINRYNVRKEDLKNFKTAHLYEI